VLAAAETAAPKPVSSRKMIGERSIFEFSRRVS
jgi:hypothetical protein